MIQEDMLGWTKNAGHTGRYDFSCIYMRERERERERYRHM